MTEDIKVGEKSIITVRWVTKSVDYSHEKEKNIRLQTANKYKVPLENVKVEPVIVGNTDNGQNVSVTQNTIQNIHDPRFQQGLFWTYLNNAEITDYDKDMILEIDSQINNQIDYDKYDKSKRYSIKWIKWDNFLSYGEGNYFDFSKLEGLILLNGEPANQSGKSTFAYDLIHYALFGKTSSSKAQVMEDYFNYNLPEATMMRVEICIEIDGVEYIIRRTLTRPELGKKNRKVSQTIDWERVENGESIALTDSESLNAENSIQTNKAIKEAIGNENDFDLVICANSDNLKSLISLKDTERGRLLARWTGLDILEAKDKLARDMWNKKKNSGLKSSIYNRETIKKEIEDIKKENIESSTTITKKEEAVVAINGELTTLNTEKDKLLASLRNVDETLAKTDINTVQVAIDRIIEQGKNKRADLNNKQARLLELKDIDFDDAIYQSKLEDKTKYTIEIANIKSDIKNLKASNETLAKSEYCPTCGRKFDNIDNSGLIAENQAKIDMLIQTGIETKSNLDKLTSEIAQLDENRKLKYEKDRLELSISALTAEIASLTQSYRQKKQLINDCIASKEAIEFNNRTNAEIGVAKENIRVKEEIKTTALQEIAYRKKDIERNEQDIRNKEALIEEINNEEKLIRHWQIYLQMIGKNGISKMVLKETLPIINASVAQMLDGICDFSVEVTIDETNDVAFNLVRGNIKKHLGSGSGFEQTVSALALRVALSNMSTLSKPPFILLDEVFGGVAKENYPNIEKLLHRIKSSYNYVFIITHEMDVKDWADSTITVKKNENGISSIA